MELIRRNIPNSITCLNLLSGVMAIICACKGDADLWGMKAYEWAFAFIGFAAVADFLDGFAARLLHAYSPMGKELDSLCDLVSFGVAPGLLLLNCLEINADAKWLAWVALAVPVAGALRLANFNIDTRQATSFIGLPIPANAIFWIGFVANVYNYPGFLPPWYFTLPIILVMAWLMVSPIPLFSLKVTQWTLKGNWMRLLTVAAALFFVFCLGLGGLMWLIVFYLFASVLSSGKVKVAK